MCPEEGNQDGERSQRQEFQEVAEVKGALLILEKGGLRGDLIIVYDFLKMSSTGSGGGVYFLSLETNGRTQGSKINLC